MSEFSMYSYKCFPVVLHASYWHFLMTKIGVAKRNDLVGVLKHSYTVYIETATHFVCDRAKH